MDSYVINGPQGTSVQIGSYVQLDVGVDFGAKDLFQTVLVESALTEGAQYGYETVGARHMSFPLTVPSGAGGLSLLAFESLLRLVARPNATLDVQLDGVASAEAVRFDVVGGRLENAYDARVHQAGRHQSVLYLDVEPYGYWPTWITLASAASVGLPGMLAIPGGSIIGDAPAQVQVIISPSVATQYPVVGTYAVDAIGWSLVPAPSFQPLLAGASWAVGAPSGGMIAEPFAPGGATAFAWPAWQSEKWMQAAVYTIASSLEPAYRGRFDAVAFVKYMTGASSALGGSSPQTTALFTMDAVSAAAPSAPLASGAPIATFNVYPLASGGYLKLPLGQLALPIVASGTGQPVLIRLWQKTPNVPTSVGSALLCLGGVELRPVDGCAGFMRGGMLAPTVGIGTSAKLVLDQRGELLAVASGTLETILPIGPAVQHRGRIPFAGPTTAMLALYGSERRVGFMDVYGQEVLEDAPAVFYRLANFPANPSVATAVATLPDSSGYPNRDGCFLASVGAPKPVLGPWGGPGDLAFDYLSGSAFPQQLSTHAGVWINIAPGYPFSVECLYAQTDFQDASGLARYAFSIGNNEATAAGIAFAPDIKKQGVSSAVSETLEFSLGVASDKLVWTGASVAAPSDAGLYSVWHHVVLTYSGASGVGNGSRMMNIWRDGSIVASMVASNVGLINAGSAGILGARPTGASAFVGTSGGRYRGRLADLAVYPTVIATARILAHYAAATSGLSQGAATDALFHAGLIYAAAAVRYRPRFQFVKGL